MHTHNSTKDLWRCSCTHLNKGVLEMFIHISTSIFYSCHTNTPQRRTFRDVYHTHLSEGSSEMFTHTHTHTHISTKKFQRCLSHTSQWKYSEMSHISTKRSLEVFIHTSQRRNFRDVYHTHLNENIRRCHTSQQRDLWRCSYTHLNERVSEMFIHISTNIRRFLSHKHTSMKDVWRCLSYTSQWRIFGEVHTHTHNLKEWISEMFITHI